ncbi:MAG: FGGY-family carbohydrate kinase, partial [Bryobacteraceae bacterium]
ITPVFRERRDPALMIERGLNTEHHAVRGRYVCFLYNQGGSLVKWYRDTFAAREQEEAERTGRDLYPALFAELSPEPSPVIVLPHFAVTGPPSFIADSCGVIVGLRLETRRADILKGILEGTIYYLKECVDALPPTGIAIEDYRVVGGGSKSDLWVQLCADILGRPMVRPRITEAGTLGAAILAGVGAGVFSSFHEAVERMVQLERSFEPDPGRHTAYMRRYAHYRALYPTLAAYLRNLVSGRAPEVGWDRPETEASDEQE